jgi:mannose-6-phosphate isomerase-like protein (cupin superfamily)
MKPRRKGQILVQRSKGMRKINFTEKFNLFDEHWSPRIVGELNGQYIKLAKLKGEFIWHTHKDEDEYFQVIKGSIIIHLRDENITLTEGECIIIPHGVEHKPEASEEALVMLFEPIATAHTGDVESGHTVKVEDQRWI